MASTYQVQAQDYYLAGSGVSLSSTSITVLNLRLPNPTPNQGAPLTMADFGPVGYGTLEPETPREENFSFTGITNNGNGTWTLTGVTRGLVFVHSGNSFPQDLNIRYSHGGGTTLRFSNSSNFYEIYANKTRVQTITGLWTFNATADGANPKIDDINYVPDPDDYIVAAYVDDTFLRLDGTNSPMQGPVDFGAFNITNLADGVALQDAVTVNQLQTAIISGALPATTLQQGIVLIATQADWDNTVDTQVIGLNTYYNLPPISMIQAGIVTEISNYISGATAANMFDDFLGGKSELATNTAPGKAPIGEMNWTMLTDSGGGNNGSVDSVSGTTGRPGIVQLVTKGIANGATAIVLGANTQYTGVAADGEDVLDMAGSSVLSDTSIGAMNQGNWYTIGSMKAVANTTCVIRFGLVKETAGVVPSTITDGIYFELDTSVDANWRGVCRAASTSSVAGITPASNTNFQKFEIIQNAAGNSVEFKIDGVTLGSVATNIPSALGQPFFYIEQLAGTTRRLQIDYWTLNMSNLNR